MSSNKAWTMRGIFASAILAASFATPSWAQTSPSYCPAPAWKLPPASGPVVYTDSNGVQYTKNQMDSLYDQVCWQQDPPDTGARGNWLRADFLARFGPNVNVRRGERMLALSSGAARQPTDPGYLPPSGYDKQYEVALELSADDEGRHAFQRLTG